MQIARPVLQKKKKIRVVENRCFQCTESIFVNLPQFAKSGLNESLHRSFWYFSLRLFGYFGLVSSLFCFCECLFHCSTYDWKTASTGVAEVHSSPWIRRFFGEMGKKLLAVNSKESVLPSSFYIECSIVNKGPVEIMLKAKQARQSNMNNALFNLTYEASDILNVNLSSGVSRLKL